MLILVFFLLIVIQATINSVIIAEKIDKIEQRLNDDKQNT